MSWVIVNRSTGEAIMETFSSETAAKINTEKFEAKEAGQYLAELNQKIKKCVYCSNGLEHKRTKYCNDLCKYRYLSMIKDSTRKFSRSQHLRMTRAGKKQREGKLDVRFN